MNILSTISETFADGPGIRYAIYTAGCTHYCKGCHNPESWCFDQGEPLEKELPRIIDEIKSNPMLTGITISGGDPLELPNSLLILLIALKEHFPDKDIWVFTGYTLEELANKINEGDKNILLCLKLIDTLVDGRFEIDLKEEITFRGSSNQRFIKSPSNVILPLLQGLPSQII